MLLLACVGFLGLGFYSEGIFSDDDIGHYLLAHYSWRHPDLLLDLWGRPAYTLLSSPFAQFGIRAAGAFNVLVSVLGCYLAFEIARTLGVARPWLAAALTALQPYLLQLSFGTLTEPLFATVLAGAALLYIRRQFAASALCISVLPLARLEGAVFLPLWLLLLAWRREWKAAALVFVFPFVVNTAGFLSTGEPLYLWHFNPYGTGQGTSFHAHYWSDYAWYWPAVTGPVLLPLLTLGATGGLGRGPRRFVVGLALSVVGLYFAVYARGLIGRVGTGNLSFLLRFLTGAAPLLGVVAALGVENVLAATGRPAWRRAILAIAVGQAVLVTLWYPGEAGVVGRLHIVMAWLAAVTAVVSALELKPAARGWLGRAFVSAALLIGIAYVARWPPIVYPAASNRANAEVAEWVLRGGWQERGIIAMAPGFWLSSGLDPYAMPHAGGFQMFISTPRELVRSSAPGTIVVWDSHQAANRVPLEMLQSPDFREIHAVSTSDDPADPLFRAGEQPFQVMVFEKIRSSPASRDEP